MRGIGLEICRQLAKQRNKVVLTARNEAQGRAACAKLAESGLDVIFHPLNVESNSSIVDFQRYAEKELGRWDVPINNAAVYLDGAQSSLDIDAATFRRTVEINLTGVLLLSQAAIPSMRRHGYGRIVNLSSDMGTAHEGSGAIGWTGRVRSPPAAIRRTACRRPGSTH